MDLAIHYTVHKSSDCHNTGSKSRLDKFCNSSNFQMTLEAMACIKHVGCLGCAETTQQIKLVF